MTSPREQYGDWFSANIYPMARKYAHKNPIIGIEFEDYVQDLVATAWEKVVNYDSEKASLSTFVNVWFGSVKFKYTDKIRNRGQLGLCVEGTDDGEAYNLADSSISSDDVASLESVRDVLGMASPVSTLLYQGYSLGSAAKACGVTPDEASAMLKSDMKIIKKAFGMEE